MGCFNVICSFTKLPIIYKEKCYKLIFGDISKLEVFDEDNNIFEYLHILKEVIPGTYNEYGDIEEDSTREIRLGGSSSEILFISKLAWDFSNESLINLQSKYDKSLMYSSDNIDKQMDNLKKLLENKGIIDPEPIDPILNEKRVIYSLAYFLKFNNNHELFDFSSNGTYGSQVLSLKQRQQYQDLRQKRLDILKKLTSNEKY